MDALNNNFSMMTVEEMNQVDGGSAGDVLVFAVTGMAVGFIEGAIVGGLGAIPGMGIGLAVGLVEGLAYDKTHK